MRYIRLLRRSLPVFAVLGMAIGIGVATQTEVEALRRRTFQGGEGARQIVSRWSGYRSAMLKDSDRIRQSYERSRRARGLGYRPVSLSVRGEGQPVATSRAVGNVYSDRQAARPARASGVVGGTGGRGASAQIVPYKWRAKIRSQGEYQDLSSLGKLSNAEVVKLAGYGPQKAETFQKHLKTRMPYATESTPDGGTIQWFETSDAAYMNSWKGSGSDRSLVSTKGRYQVGLKFDANNNYQSLGVGEQ